MNIEIIETEWYGMPTSDDIIYDTYLYVSAADIFLTNSKLHFTFTYHRCTKHNNPPFYNVVNREKILVRFISSISDENDIKTIKNYIKEKLNEFTPTEDIIKKGEVLLELLEI